MVPVAGSPRRSLRSSMEVQASEFASMERATSSKCFAQGVAEMIEQAYEAGVIADRRRQLAKVMPKPIATAMPAAEPVGAVAQPAMCLQRQLEDAAAAAARAPAAAPRCLSMLCARVRSVWDVVLQK